MLWALSCWCLHGCHCYCDGSRPGVTAPQLSFSAYFSPLPSYFNVNEWGSMVMETMFRVNTLSLLLPLLLVSNHVNIIKLILPELVMDCWDVMEISRPRPRVSARAATPRVRPLSPAWSTSTSCPTPTTTWAGSRPWTSTTTVTGERCSVENNITLIN